MHRGPSQVGGKMLKKTSRMLLMLIIPVRYESCETQPCSPVSDYRLEQCRAFNGNNFKIEDLPKASSSSSLFSSL